MRLSDDQKNSKTKDKQTKNVLNYINEENQYTKALLKKTEKLQDKLYKEMVGRIKKDDSSIPYEYNGYWYITKFKKGKELDREKKMGGGMMGRRMGYSQGKLVGNQKKIDGEGVVGKNPIINPGQIFKYKS